MTRLDKLLVVVKRSAYSMYVTQHQDPHLERLIQDDNQVLNKRVCLRVGFLVLQSNWYLLVDDVKSYYESSPVFHS